MVPDRRRKPLALSVAIGVVALLSLLLLSPSRPLFADSSTSVTEDSSALTPQDRALVATVPFSSGPLLNRTGAFDTRFSIPPGTAWQDIYENPHIVSLYIAEVPGSAHREITEGDVEAVFPIEARYLFQALGDYAAYPRITPRTVYDAERSTLDGPFAYHKRVQKVSAQFLGFGETYLFVTNNYESRLTKSSWGIKWNLEQSLDDKFYSLMGSWYVQQIQCGAKPCSYLRYFNHTGLTDRPPVPIPILRYFTGNNFRSLLVDFFHEAVRIRAEEKRTAS